MPQATNRGLVRDMNNCPIGKGTVYNTLLDISAHTRQRAIQANVCELERLGKIERFLEREQRIREVIRSRLVAKTQKSLRDMQAFEKVISNEYRVKNFATMRRGFDRSMIQTPRLERRVKIETRIYNSGFSMKALQPEIKRTQRKMDPERKRRFVKRKILEYCHDQSDVVINREVPSSAVYRTFRDERHWRCCPVDQSNSEQADGLPEQETARDVRAQDGNGRSARKLTVRIQGPEYITTAVDSKVSEYITT
jgi:hypothetical protein